MDALTIQSKIYAGRAKAALRIGLSCAVHRSLSAASPLNQVATLNAAFNSGDSNYKKPSTPGNPIWYGDFDGNQTLPGDYLIRVSDGAVWFVAAQQQLLPIICIDCNRAVSVVRQNQQSSVGALNYGGKIPGNEAVILGASSPWPASILFGGRRQSTGAGLPEDVGQSGFRIMLPPSVPITIIAGDIIIDDLANRYVVESAEISDTGYRITCNEIHS